MEKMRLLQGAWAIAFGFAFLQVFLATILALGISLTEGESRLWFLGILGTATLFGAILFIVISIRIFSVREAPFAMTTREFQKDKECLESVLKS